MAELMQKWRTGPDDDDGLTEPIRADQWRADLDENAPLGDISTGYAWRERWAGMTRIVDEEWGDGHLVRDTSDVPDRRLRFSSLPFGISLSMNTDWFETTKERGRYSVGAVYFVVNNLPRHLRFLRENICLACIMPGPNEPSQYALDQMLEPIVNEIIELQTGVEMRVRTGDPPVYENCMVYTDLCHNIADLIARIKLGGGAGVASELHFCLYCRSRLSSISMRAGFIRADFPYRDLGEDLDNAYFWKSLESDEDRELFFEETGNRYTILHKIPGWHTKAGSPVDAMHLLYLGATNWILKQVVVGPNLLAPRLPNTPDPIDVYNAALEDDLWLPYNVGRLPPKIDQSRGRIKAEIYKSYLL
ncbi:hypothetical protein FRC08_004512 [Ceratobasidium sp. 394]|nr:hypothetical protein FRC08_004512 [Ceratobasidium sp. 394]